LVGQPVVAAHSPWKRKGKVRSRNQGLNQKKENWVHSGPWRGSNIHNKHISGAGRDTMEERGGGKFGADFFDEKPEREKR